MKKSDKDSIESNTNEDDETPRTSVNAHAVQHVEHILSGHIARRAGRVRAAAESAHRAERLGGGKEGKTEQKEKIGRKQMEERKMSKEKTLCFQKKHDAISKER